MATMTVPQVVEFPQPAISETISQAQLAKIISLRQERERLDAELAAAEAEVRAALETESLVESGLLRAFLKTSERRSVAWKQVAERELGEGFCKRVLAATKPETFTHLVVTA